MVLSADHWGVGQYTGGGYGTFRFTGQARDGSEVLSWSLILKALAESEQSESQDEGHWNHWKREILAYQSSLLDSLPGLGAPRCYSVIEQPGNEYWIWLEEVKDEIEGRWSLDLFELAALQPGRFNGAYLTSRPVPARPWLSRGRVRDWLEECGPTLRDLHNKIDHPLARNWFRGDNEDGTLRLWNDQEALLAVLDELPRTLCHHDAHSRNLLTRRGPDERLEMVGIDWQMLGTGAVGEELALLMGMSLRGLDLDVRRASEVDKAVVEAYLEGLEDAGWNGNARTVRFGFAASAALLVGVGFLRSLDGFFDRPFLEEVIGHPFDVIADRYALVQDYLLDLGDEARELANALS